MWKGRIALGAGAGLLLALASLSPVLADAPSDGVVLTRTTLQAVCSGCTATVSWTTEVVDEGGYWDVGSPTVVTVPRAAWCQATFTSKKQAGNGTSWHTMILVNGGEVARLSYGLTNHNDPNHTITATWLAAQGDSVTFQGFMFGGSTNFQTARASVMCNLDVTGGGGSGGSTPCETPAPSGGECLVEVTAFTESAAETLNLGIFSVVVVGGFLVMMLAWIAVQGMRR